MTEKEAMVALTYSQRSPFYCRSHFVFPNVSWGLRFRHELDLLSVSMPAKIGTEQEIIQLLRLGNMRYWMLQKKVTAGDSIV